MTSLSEWRESRRLTSQRAGVVSQQFASEQLNRYARSHVRWLAISTALILLMSAGIWLLLSSRPGFQGLAAGLMAGVGLTFLFHWCVISSGATSGTMRLMGKWACSSALTQACNHARSQALTHTGVPALA